MIKNSLIFDRQEKMGKKKDGERKMKKLSKGLVWLVLVGSLLLNGYFLIRKIGGLRGFGEKEGRVVVRVVDGDTFDVEGEERVRLAGANAPEYPKECLSEQAKQRLIELVAGKRVRVEVLEEDSFGRLVAFVFKNGLFIDKALVEEGLARANSVEHPRYGVELAESEETAQKAERGIWSKFCQGPKQADCLIKGNVRRDRGTKVYHLPGCFNYEKIVVNERKGDQWFCTEEEARAAGFRRSKDCP